MVWNPFAISSVEEATRRLQDGLDEVRTACLKVAEPGSTCAEQALSLIGRIPEETVHVGRGRKVPRWYRGMTHINLPDAHVGYAVVDIEGTKKAIQTMVR